MKIWRLKTRTISLEEPLLVGIINATPDSFSDGGQFAANVDGASGSRFEVDVAAVVRKACELVRDGAGMLDVGGESSRPGSEPVGAAEEERRVIPVIKTLAKAVDVPIAVDTYRASVADAALAAGAEVVNDVGAGRFIEAENRFVDEASNENAAREEMAQVVSRQGAAVVLTHMRGVPKTMQSTPPEYPNGVAEEVAGFLARRRDAFVAAGVEPEKIALDPGVGFGKTFEQNWELIRRAGVFLNLGCATYYGISRKRFLKETLERFETRRGVDSGFDATAWRDDATAATTALLASSGVRIFRTHNVRKCALTLDLWKFANGLSESKSR